MASRGFHRKPGGHWSKSGLALLMPQVTKSDYQGGPREPNWGSHLRNHLSPSPSWTSFHQSTEITTLWDPGEWAHLLLEATACRSPWENAPHHFPAITLASLENNHKWVHQNNRRGINMGFLSPLANEYKDTKGRTGSNVSQTSPNR